MFGYKRTVQNHYTGIRISETHLLGCDFWYSRDRRTGRDRHYRLCFWAFGMLHLFTGHMNWFKTWPRKGLEFAVSPLKWMPRFMLPLTDWSIAVFNRIERPRCRFKDSTQSKFCPNVGMQLTVLCFGVRVRLPKWVSGIIHRKLEARAERRWQEQADWMEAERPFL